MIAENPPAIHDLRPKKNLTASQPVKTALGLAEVPFFSITALVADAMLKTAGVRLLGFETTGNQNLLIRIEGEVASVASALATARQRAGELGATAAVKAAVEAGARAAAPLGKVIAAHVIARPHEGLAALMPG